MNIKAANTNLVQIGRNLPQITVIRRRQVGDSDEL
jgi:hypothetical protein